VSLSISITVAPKVIVAGKLDDINDFGKVSFFSSSEICPLNKALTFLGYYLIFGVLSYVAIQPGIGNGVNDTRALNRFE
jgi:hypothetical protein